MNLNFHQTFKPEKSYLSELLRNSDEITNLTLDQLSNLTGIPQGKSSGKLVPHLYYAKLMGLLDFSVNNGLYSVSLTELGKIIKSEDVSISENISLILMHHNIIKELSGADLWYFCFNLYFDKYGRDSKYDYFLKEIEQKYGKVKLGPFTKSYEELFSSLDLLDINTKEDRIRFNKFDFNQDLIPAIGYIFYDLWDDIFPDEIEITSMQLDSLHFKNRFCWTNTDELNALERLSEYGLIRINKQLVPFTIIKLDNKNNVLNRLYDELV